MTEATRAQLPPLAWARRMIQRSSGWKVVIKFVESGEPVLSTYREATSPRSLGEMGWNDIALDDALLELARLPFAELEVKGRFTPPFEPPYELRAKDTNDDAVRVNGCIRVLVSNGLKRLSATSFDLDPAVIMTWAQTGSANAIAVRLESVARMDSVNFAEFSAALVKFISAADNLEELHLPLLTRGVAGRWIVACLLARRLSTLC